MTTNLRDRLRDETRPQHARVDRLFSRFDLGVPAGLIRFHTASFAAVQALSCAPGPYRPQAEALRDETADALAGDLHEMGAPAVTERPGGPLDATATYYVLLGSRLGKRLLERRWRAGGGAATGPGRYFALPDRGGAWRDLCQDLAGRAGRGAAADTILNDAIRLFAIFADAAQSVLAEEPLHV